MKRLFCLLGALALPGCAGSVPGPNQPVAANPIAVNPCQPPRADASPNAAQGSPAGGEAACNNEAAPLGPSQASAVGIAFGTMLMGGLVHAAVEAASHAGDAYPAFRQPLAAMLTPAQVPSPTQVVPAIAAKSVAAPMVQTAKLGT